jgi:hypothetical protein
MTCCEKMALVRYNANESQGPIGDLLRLALYVHEEKGGETESKKTVRGACPSCGAKMMRKADLGVDFFHTYCGCCNTETVCS